VNWGSAAAALVVVGAVVGGAFAVGLAPAPDDRDETAPLPTTAATTPTARGPVETRPAPSATTSTAKGPVETRPAPSTSAPRPRFAFAVDSAEACGQTCRDVTSTLSNTGATDATSVAVSTRIYAGQTVEGGVVWEGRESVGALPAGESYTTTRRVELSLAGAVAVQNAGGWITVQTTVASDQRTVTFAEPRRVA
jgi:hypothetical protein